MFRAIRLAPLALVILVPACQPASNEFTEQDATAIRQLLEETYPQALIRGDIEAATAMWAEDAYRVPPHGAALEGYDAIRAEYDAMPYAVTDLAWSDVKVDGCGDLAFMRGDYSFTAESEEAGAYSETGTTFLVFRRDDGQWKVTNNMWRPDPPVVEGDDVAAISALHGMRLEAAAAADIDAFLESMTDDAVLMPPDGPAIEGREAMRAFLGEMFETYVVDVEKPYSSITVVGDWAFEDYTYEMTLTPRAGGESIVDAGKGMFVYRRGEDGRWRIARDVWNHDG